MRWLVLGLPIVNAAAALALALSAQNWPTPSFWSKLTRALVASTFLTVMIPVVQIFISERGERRRRLELEEQERVRDALAGSLLLVAKECGAPWDKTGIQAFKVEGWLWRKRQVLVAKLRLSSSPSSGVKWSKGKGVIGRCWEQRRHQWESLDHHPFMKLGNVPPHEWEGQGLGKTFGLTHAEYTLLGHKYGTIACAPILQEGRYRGCVAMDVPPGIALTNRELVIETLERTAGVVLRLLRE